MVVKWLNITNQTSENTLQIIQNFKNIKMRIQKISAVEPMILEAINSFLNQLFEDERQITRKQVEDIISDRNSNLFFAVNEEGEYLGMITIGTYFSPSGKKAWIEDVVVDQKYRGEGVGIFLTTFAIEFAREIQSDVVMLTSKPSRISANNLYKKLGFEQRVTNVYRFLLK